MRNWDTRDESGTDKGCEWEKDWEDVRLVSKRLDIPCRMVRVRRIDTSVCSCGPLQGRSHEGILEQRLPTIPESVGNRWNPKPRCVVQ